MEKLIKFTGVTREREDRYEKLQRDVEVGVSCISTMEWVNEKPTMMRMIGEKGETLENISPEYGIITLLYPDHTSEYIVYDRDTFDRVKESRNEYYRSLE